MQRIQWISVLVLLQVSAAATSLGAQESDLIPAGSRVRVATEYPKGVIGTVIRSSGSSLFFVKADPADTVAVDYADITSLDLSLGRQHRELHTVAMAGLIGAAAGLATAAIVEVIDPAPNPALGETIPDRCSVLHPNCIEEARLRIQRGHYPPLLVRCVKGAGIGALAGLLVGAVVGRKVRYEVWKRIPSDQYRMHISVAPVGVRGITLGVSITP
jgi:hypothetical protein